MPRNSILMPFCYGQQVRVTRDTWVDSIQSLVPGGTEGMVIDSRPGGEPVIALKGFDRHLPIPALNLLHINRAERIKTRIARR